MNTPRAFDDAPMEREWQAQERALEHERRGLKANGDADDVGYRLLARALRQPPPEGLPSDFADRVARRAEALGKARDAVSARFEQRLLQAMIAVFGLAVVVVVVCYGAEWWPATSATARVGHLLGDRWLIALLGCVGLSVAAQRTASGRRR
ncbi:MAG: hypothetical protein ABI843_11790 [Dokdonella sp.]